MINKSRNISSVHRNSEEDNSCPEVVTQIISLVDSNCPENNQQQRESDYGLLTEEEKSSLEFIAHYF